MKNYIIPLLFSTLFINTAFADDLPEAPKDELESSIKACQEWADEDKVPADEVKQYILNCVNDDLTNMGYKNVSKID